MTLNPAAFKAYDVRGTYPDQLDEEGAGRIGRAFPALTGAKRVAVGHDVRLSSPSMSSAFHATKAVLRDHGGLWFWDESYVISRKRDSG